MPTEHLLFTSLSAGITPCIWYSPYVCIKPTVIWSGAIRRGGRMDSTFFFSCFDPLPHSSSWNRKWWMGWCHHGHRQHQLLDPRTKGFSEASCSRFDLFQDFCSTPEHPFPPVWDCSSQHQSQVLLLVQEFDYIWGISAKWDGAHSYGMGVAL